MNDNKEKYQKFCNSVYVPIYSKSWWMDAVCGEDNWGVWLYEQNGEVLAAMPYYMEQRGKYRYITKAPLTQTNGIVFAHAINSKPQSKASFERRVIYKACEFVKTSGIDVYEQQYPYSFQNWQPFYWNHYSCLLRYTYVIEDTQNIEEVMKCFTSVCRNRIKKGQKYTVAIEQIDKTIFYKEHEKIFLKQGLSCPFSQVLWERLYKAITDHNAGQILCARDSNNNIASLIFIVWDEQSMYFISGGAMPEYSNLETYSYLTFHCIKLASEMGLKYDFEGSMIERIAHAFQQFGGVPKPYYRIRKIFNEEIIRQEAEVEIQRLEKEMAEGEQE